MLKNLNNFWKNWVRCISDPLHGGQSNLEGKEGYVLLRSAGIYHRSHSRQGVRIYFYSLNKQIYIYIYMYVYIYLFIYFSWRLFTLQYCGGFCHTLTWISHGCTCVPHPDPSSHLPLHPIPQGHPSAPALSTLSHALNLDWWFVSHMIIYMFQCHSPKSSCPLPLPQSPKDCSIHLCLFCCLTYRVIITIFLNSIYMR